MTTDLTPKQFSTVSKPMDFPFSLSLGVEHAQEILTARNTAAEKISSLISQFADKADCSPQILPWILNNFSSQGEYQLATINLLGKVLQALARELHAFQKLDGKVTFIEFALKDPEFVALMFANSERVVEDLLNDLPDASSFPDPFSE